MVLFIPSPQLVTLGLCRGPRTNFPLFPLTDRWCTTHLVMLHFLFRGLSCLKLWCSSPTANCFRWTVRWKGCSDRLNVCKAYRGILLQVNFLNIFIKKIVSWQFYFKKVYILSTLKLHSYGPRQCTLKWPLSLKSLSKRACLLVSGPCLQNSHVHG